MTERRRQSGWAAVVLAAGLGTRMKSARPKVLHEIAGRPLLLHVLDAAARAGAARRIVVTGAADHGVAAAAGNAGQDVSTAVQDPPQGTGHAVLSAASALDGFDGNVVVLFGGDPLIRPETIAAMLDELDKGAGIVVLGFEPDDPGLYGRLVLDGDGKLVRIVEARDASPEELAIGLCNGGVMAISGAHVWTLLRQVGNDNAKNEYYLTDIIALARKAGLDCAVVTAPASEVLGVDTRADLAEAEAEMQKRLRAAAMAGGATLIDPSSVHLSWDTRLGRDVIVEPNVFFGPGVTVGEGATIRAFSHVEGAQIAAKATVGPFARLRPGTEVGEAAKIGNFVEVKKAVIEEGAKVSHLSYIGDARVGAHANVGAGTITCNYDGFAKHFTDIGAGAFIGSDTLLVAPVKVGDGAYTGSGSVITKDVPADALAVTRPELRQVEGWAVKFRARNTRAPKE
jgi:bifunctional UDP-N-acetylglucosamine pyrophosphorylase/glucosamine-1-phosphate N-acetyltransferase